MNTLPEILSALRSNDDEQRTAALAASRELGSAAIAPIAPLLADPETETRRAAKRALEPIVHDAGKDGSLGQPARQVEAQLLSALQAATDDQARRDLIWFLSEVGGEPAIQALGARLQEQAVREDARCALERIPLPSAVTALKEAFPSAPEDFKFALAESLRKRNEKVDGYPSQRLVPAKSTEVQPVA